MMGKMTRLLNGRKKHKGNALIMVIITVAFVGMLVAMVVYGAYGNFVMKANDTRGKNNFYTAESVLDIINAGIQIDVSDGILDAYTYANKIADSELAVGDTREAVFRQRFVQYMKDKIEDPSNAGQWMPSYLLGKLKNGRPDDMIWTAVNNGTPGAYVGINTAVVDSPPNKLEFGEGNAYIAIRNVLVVYTNDQGYVSNIETDIRITTPKMKTAGEQRSASVQEYCLIANNSIIADTLYNDGTHSGGTNAVEVGGNVNAGKTGLYVANDSKVDFLSAPSDAGVDTFYYLIGKDMQVEDTDRVTVSDRYTSFWNDIKIKSSRASLDGVMFVADDLDIGGRNSNVTLAGSYYGYGNSPESSSESSSILINGANTTINTASLNELVLSGYTFIGATNYDADKTRYDGVYGAGSSDNDDEIIDIVTYNKELEDNGLVPTGVPTGTPSVVPQNKEDILMGTSIDAKADQMLYLIPSECIAFDHASGTQVVGLNKNPMTVEEFDKLSKTKILDADDNPTTDNKYDVVNLSALWTKLGASYTDTFKAVYRRINGKVMVYLYLDFGSDDVNAAAFYKAYYEKAPEELDAYISPYYNKTASVMGSTLLTRAGGEGSEYDNLTIQGNFFYYDTTGNLKMLDGNIATSSTKTSRVLDMKDHRSVEYLSRLYTNHPDSSSFEKSIYKNLIHDNKVAAFSATRTYTKLWNDDPTTPFADSPDYHAVVANGDYVYGPGSDDKICVIVASGNIYLNRDFSGVAIAGNNVILGPGCTNVNREANLVRQALKNLGDEGYSDGNGRKFSDYFKEDVTGGGAGGTGNVSEDEREEDENRSIGR
ncbi:MAG: hypothetical protein IK123_06975, partial [Lachnospiraceae bacterium]|nr:hypothetical protein [Lachnospiraceae bacterium]